MLVLIFLVSGSTTAISRRGMNLWGWRSSNRKWKKPIFFSH